MFEQGLPQDDFESPPLEALQTISEMCRELPPGNATILYHGGGCTDNSKELEPLKREYNGVVSRCAGVGPLWRARG